MIKHRTKNPYLLYEEKGNKAKRELITQRIDNILEETIKNISRDIEKASVAINELDGARLGIGDTLTDEEIISVFKKTIKERIDGGTIWEHLYNLIH